MLFTMPNNTNHCQAHRGITLIEVMMSTMVVSLGILGLVALIPLGTHLTERGVQADRVASLGERAYHEAKARQVFNPSKWFIPGDTDPIGNIGPDEISLESARLPVRQPYMIDPLFFGANGTDSSRVVFPYATSLAVAGASTASLDSASTRPIQMPRLSLRNDSVASALSLPLARQSFQSYDDLAFERPDDGDLPSFQRFYERGTTPTFVKRQALGEYSWMIMLTPEPFETRKVSTIPTALSPTDASWMQPPIDITRTPAPPIGTSALTPVLSRAATDEYTAHVLIVKNRQGIIPQGAIGAADPELVQSNERILNVSGFLSSGGYSTGEVVLQQTTGSREDAEERVLKLSNGDWICLVKRMPANANYPRGDIYQWYRVVMVDEVLDNAGTTTGSALPFSRRVTISGPDWPLATAASAPTHAIVVDGVVGVYSKRVKLESQTPWTP